ncbi:hypothetical protein GH714_038820 [Hevea brasiliensis]|uniref:Beta-galactosidase n=1 Tax=Hevea brasiliensis TaxID=3981 RepID=A0A6A6K9S3_HEVBR|nr:hypothetical protein GH714_038820 [Hevea brasiliensis]
MGRRILISGSIHYPRSTPEMWPDLIQKAKDGGLDVIETYVFWNGHEPTPGNGIPVWLKYVPGTEFRTNNGPFKAAMQKFTEKIVSMMQSEKLFETQGGPIILSQIENEFGPVEWQIGAPGKLIQNGQLRAVGLGTGVPWVMCKQDDAPDPVCDTPFLVLVGLTPAMDSTVKISNQTKIINLKCGQKTGLDGYTEFGGSVPYRPAEDLAFSVARLYRMVVHCKTIYGLPRDPKWGHLRDLHKAIKLCEPALVSVDPTVTTLGAHVFNSKSSCAAFLANYDTKYSVKVIRQWTIDLPLDGIPVQLGAQSTQMKMTPVGSAFSWQSYIEEAASSYTDDTTRLDGLLEQINITRDATDYLWYMTDVKIDPDEGFLRSGQDPILTIFSAGHSLQVFINGQLSGTVYGSLNDPKLTFSQNVKLIAGINKISLLSAAVGLPNVGLHFESWNAGVLGPVTLKGLNEGTRDLSGWNWSYKTTFDAPEGNEPLALDMSSMGKGQVWVNGRSVGRHWPGYIARGSCGDCNYAGTFDDKKCRSNCGEPSQRWYHVPRSWVNPSGNLLVVFEEWGGDPSAISLVKRSTGSVCADIFEGQPSLKNWKMIALGKFDHLQPKAHLWCPSGQKISQIKFASYGMPQGTCGSFREGNCHAHKSYVAFEKKCVGKQSCSLTVAPEVFGGDPCPDSLKKLSVEAVCS